MSHLLGPEIFTAQLCGQVDILWTNLWSLWTCGRPHSVYVVTCDRSHTGCSVDRVTGHFVDSVDIVVAIAYTFRAEHKTL